jgi:alanyl-tRNA synthetase
VLEHLTINNHPALVLDRTYFYPTGGGQPHDTGEIDGIQVLDVFAREGDSAVVHVLAQPGSAAQVNCRIDRTRRVDHMQQHTGQHILSRAFIQLAEAQTVGFHLSDDTVTIDLNRAGLNDEIITQVENLANQSVYEDRAVTVRLVSPEDADGIRMRKLPEHLHTDGLRIVDIDGFDVTACGGTHVARTGEIGIIKILRLERRSDKTRVEFRCGRRALDDYRAKNALIYQLTSALTCGMGEVPSAVQRLQDNLKTAQSALKSATQQLVDYEAIHWLAMARELAGGKLIKAAFADREAGDIRLLASKLAQTPGVIALLGATGEPAHLVFSRSADLPQDMNTLLKQALALIQEGRGGGQPSLAQGSGSASLEQLNAALDEAERLVRA